MQRDGIYTVRSGYHTLMTTHEMTQASKKGFQVDPICPLCGENSESVSHALLQCKDVSPVWFASPLAIHIPVHYEVDFSSWLLHMLATGDNKAADSIFNLVWALWNRRNDWVHNSRQSSIDLILSKANSIMIPPPAENPNSTNTIQYPILFHSSTAYKSSSKALQFFKERKKLHIQ
ncbi:hypothetical protein RIF29_28997 [Crotalaria pallida]|uniref:Reverse transcriptase zinc-binding domain-containing protein n=1 Tax=Crotalaria pallida TaxID=3830 RepID=A0AAN9EDT0_CROPI